MNTNGISNAEASLIYTQQPPKHSLHNLSSIYTSIIHKNNTPRVASNVVVEQKVKANTNAITNGSNNPLKKAVKLTGKENESVDDSKAVQQMKQVTQQEKRNISSPMKHSALDPQPYFSLKSCFVKNKERKLNKRSSKTDHTLLVSPITAAKNSLKASQKISNDESLLEELFGAESPEEDSSNSNKDEVVGELIHQLSVLGSLSKDQRNISTKSFTVPKTEEPIQSEEKPILFKPSILSEITMSLVQQHQQNLNQRSRPNSSLSEKTPPSPIMSDSTLSSSQNNGMISLNEPNTPTQNRKILSKIYTHFSLSPMTPPKHAKMFSPSNMRV